jgi:prolyl-tRNA editing enzyme YbaK/EbsC (Cys-tRNA(Pro) deacylase)
MSKSLTRVMDTLAASGHGTIALEMPAQTHTAQDAARVVGCDINQIATSVIFSSKTSERLFLFVMSGGHKIDMVKAATAAGEPLDRANPHVVHTVTGFAIGSVPPVGHLTPVRVFLDHNLLKFSLVYATAGTPRHVFAVDPNDLVKISKAQVSDIMQ